MQTRPPSIGKIAVAAGFALSCFALLLFLWVTFGGPIPFKPESYRFTADFPEAITLQKEADVRVGGVTVGKVKELELPPEENATRAVIEIEPEYAPISSDAKAILRSKTLLGETYVELTTGSQTDAPDPSQGETAQAGTIDVGQISGDDAPEPIPEGGHLEDGQVIEQVQIDEIFDALDEQTRQSFQLWMKNSAIAVDGRGQDLNDAFGNIGPFSEDASDVLGTLRRQEDALKTLVRSTGDVFAALTARNQELAGAIVGSNRTFRALASRDEALAESFRILPTFQRESRFTLDRLQEFAINTDPLVQDLKPVARDLSPTLADLRRLAPHARDLFKKLGPLTKASKRGLPALRDFLDELRPVMDSLDPFLANFNPILRYLDYYKAVAGDFLGNPSAATAGALPPAAGQSEPRHLSRQMSIFNAESLSIYPERIRTNRGNGYLLPGAIANPFSNSQGEVFPSHDCNNTHATGGLGSGQVTPGRSGVPASNPPAKEGGYYPLSNQVPPEHPFAAFAPCTIQSRFPGIFGGGRVPYVPADP
jgi:phospholipid/cholesterol/gamma-HCH transport system substrate-binding protein